MSFYDYKNTLEPKKLDSEKILARANYHFVHDVDEKSENLFKWYQQLTAESLGKKGNGILPVISTMPKDNHSLLQLYLDGPKNNFYTFFNVKDKNSPNFYNSKLTPKVNIRGNMLTAENFDGEA